MTSWPTFGASRKPLIAECAAHGITAGRVDGRSGVWLDGGARKSRRSESVSHEGVALRLRTQRRPRPDRLRRHRPLRHRRCGRDVAGAQTGRPITVDGVRGEVAQSVAYWLDHPLPRTGAVAASTSALTRIVIVSCPSPTPNPDRRHRARWPQTAAAGGAQRTDAHRAQAQVDQDTGHHGPGYSELKGLVKREGLHTVCEEAGCPNIYECWEDREATFLIGGEQCTRRCDFCQIDTGKPAELDRDEPRPRRGERRGHGTALFDNHRRRARRPARRGRVAVCGDGAQDPRAQPRHRVENLIPDFHAKPDLLAEVFDSRPEVLAHNLETVPRIFKRIRPAFYDRSLDVLTQARDAGLVTGRISSLGLGETTDEVRAALRDLHDAGCDIVTITRYLRPSPRHHPVERWVKPEEFVELSEFATNVGFAGVMAGPLVRSSYRAGRLYAQAMARHGRLGAGTGPPGHRGSSAAQRGVLGPHSHGPLTAVFGAARTVDWRSWQRRTNPRTKRPKGRQLAANKPQGAPQALWQAFRCSAKG